MLNKEYYYIVSKMRFAYLIGEGEVLTCATSEIGNARTAVEDHRDVV